MVIRLPHPVDRVTTLWWWGYPTLVIRLPHHGDRLPHIILIRVEPIPNIYPYLYWYAESVSRIFIDNTLQICFGIGIGKTQINLYRYCSTIGLIYQYTMKYLYKMPVLVLVLVRIFWHVLLMVFVCVGISAYKYRYW